MSLSILTLVPDRFKLSFASVFPSSSIPPRLLVSLLTGRGRLKPSGASSSLLEASMCTFFYFRANFDFFKRGESSLNSSSCSDIMPPSFSESQLETEHCF